MSRLLTMGGLAVLLAMAVAVSPAAQEKTRLPDWPQFRGPNRTGVSTETGLLEEWPEGGPPLAWKATGLGEGFATVAVAGDRIFTLGDVGDDCLLFALERAGGKQLWSTKVGRAGGHRNPGPRGTPTVDGRRVYALGQFGDLVCVEAVTGKEVWRRSFPRDFKGRSGGWNYAESPLVDHDRLVCTPGGPEATMVALDSKTGRVIWKAVVPGERAAYSSPVVAQVGGVRHYVQLLANSVVGIRAQDGKLLWRYGDSRERFAGNTANVPTPIVKGEHVFCSAGYNRGGALLRLTAKDGDVQAEEVYYNPELKNKHGGIILVGEHLYGDTNDSGNLFCAEFRTGKVLWKRGRAQTSGRGSAALTYADGHLYVRYQNAYVALVEATTQGYKEKSGFRIPNGRTNSWAHPVVVGGKLYLREKDTLWCYDVKAR